MKSYFNNKHILGILIISLIVGLFSPTTKINAQEQLRSTLKEVAEKIIEISEIKREINLTAEERLQKETQARKNALSKIFDLTLLEDKDLKNKLNGLKNLSEEQREVKDDLLSVFVENENAYKEMKKRLDEAGTLEEIKQLATDFKNWRNAVYNSKAEKIVSFVLIFQQKKTLAIAKERLEKIKINLEELENEKLISREETDNLLQIAETSLQKAEELNKQAENSLQSNPITSLLERLGLKQQESPKVLIAKSLGKIKIAYAAFLDLSNLVKDKIEK